MPDYCFQNMSEYLFFFCTQTQTSAIFLKYFTDYVYVCFYFTWFFLLEYNYAKLLTYLQVFVIVVGFVCVNQLSHFSNKLQTLLVFHLLLSSETSVIPILSLCCLSLILPLSSCCFSHTLFGHFPLYFGRFYYFSSTFWFNFLYQYFRNSAFGVSDWLSW